MKRFRIFYIAVFVGLAACTERIDIDLDSTYTRLVVDGAITTDTTSHIVKLTKTTEIYYNKPNPPVTDAVVTISDGTTVFPLTESSLEPGVYRTAPDVFGVVGKEYELKISNVDINDDGKKEEYTAKSKICPVGDVDSIKLLYTALGPDSVFVICCFAQDPPTREFYVFRALVNGQQVYDKITDLFIQDDELFNGNYTNGIWCQFLYQNGPTKRPKQKVKPGDIVTFELNSITKDYYNFILELQSGIYYNPIFSGPPANTRTNVDNGAVGYFAAYSKSFAKRTVPPKPWVLDFPY